VLTSLFTETSERGHNLAVNKQQQANRFVAPFYQASRFNKRYLHGNLTNYMLLQQEQQTAIEHTQQSSTSLRADNSCCRARQVHYRYYPYKLESNPSTQVFSLTGVLPIQTFSWPIIQELESQNTHTFDSSSVVQGREKDLVASKASNIVSQSIVTTRPLDKPIEVCIRDGHS
jgi:hypothetical protein